MKWYSIKKYKPPMETICLICSADSYLYVGKLITAAHPCCWIIDSECDEPASFIERRIANITHFCIPDPLEIMED